MLQATQKSIVFSHLVFRRLPSGQYESTGELPKGTRKVRIDRDGHLGCAIFSGKRAVRIVSEAIQTNHACA
jgi:hypothetical protein